jgi:hypothetical protein
MALQNVDKRLDMFRRQLLLLWRDAEDVVPQEFQAQMLTFRAATQNLLTRLGLVKSVPAGKLIFRGDRVDDGLPDA